jgi:hypothetical protein
MIVISIEQCTLDSLDCNKQGCVVETEHLCSIVIKQPTNAASSSIFINVFLDLLHVSARHCHHQEVVVSSEDTQAVCTVDVYGLRPVQRGHPSPTN